MWQYKQATESIHQTLTHFDIDLLHESTQTLKHKFLTNLRHFKTIKFDNAKPNKLCGSR